MRHERAGRGLVVLTFSLRTALVLGLLSGIAAVASAKDPPAVRLWNWNIHDNKYQQKMYKLFNERHPDIKIEYSSILNTVCDTTPEAAFVANEPPDLFLPSGKYSFYYLRTKGLIRPLNEVAPNDEELKDWMALYPPYLKRFTEGVTLFDGKVYAVNLEGETPGIMPLYYNKTLFKEAGLGGPPQTQSELRQFAAKFTQAGGGKYFGISHGSRYRGGFDVTTSVYLGKDGLEAMTDLAKRMEAGFDAAIKDANAAGIKVSRADFYFPDWDHSKDYVQKK